MYATWFITCVDQSLRRGPHGGYMGPMFGDLVESRESVASAAAGSVANRHVWFGYGCWKWRAS